MTQAKRARGGAGALAGNHVIIQRDGGGYVVLAHLRTGSIRVEDGERVAVGRELGQCGNSGNSTQPHVHVQVMDSPDPFTARGLPLHSGTTGCCRLPVDRRLKWSVASPTKGTSSSRSDADEPLSCQASAGVRGATRYIRTRFAQEPASRRAR